MKKTFIFGLMAAALGFTACSSDDDLNVINNTQKGMVLRATVEQPAETRATIDYSEATWKFAFATGDNVSVTNSVAAGTYYTFTNDGTDFKSEDAQTTATDATWYAYFPSNEVSLVGQSGTMEAVANKYALAGKTASATTGKDGLRITMSPKVAILVIDNQKGAIDINVKASIDTWVSGLNASEDGFKVTTESTKQTLLSATETGKYYVAVPAGVQLSVKDGDKVIKSTGASGLVAGKYYNVSNTVTFDLNGITGTAPETQKVAIGGKVTKPTDPTDANHTFAGWYKTKNATTGALSDPWNFDNDIVEADMTLYAKWTRTLESIYTNSDIPKATNNTAPDNAWENGDGGKAFIAYSTGNTVLYLYKQLQPSGAKQLSCRKTENFTKIGDDYVLDYILGGKFYGVFTLHMTGGKFTSVTYNGDGTNYSELSGTYTAPPAN